MSSGYPDEPTDLFEGAPYWRALGRNGYWAVDERTVGATGARRTVVALTSKSEAHAVSGALNDAYVRGMKDMTRRIAKAIDRLTG